MKRLMPFALAAVLFVLFISFNYKPVPRTYRDLNKKDSLLQPAKVISTIADIGPGRPAGIEEISGAANGLRANAGAGDTAVPDIIFGKAKPGGNLPFELPSSMEAVRHQKEGFTSNDPWYKFGSGLS